MRTPQTHMIINILLCGKDLPSTSEILFNKVRQRECCHNKLITYAKTKSNRICIYKVIIGVYISIFINFMNVFHQPRLMVVVYTQNVTQKCCSKPTKYIWIKCTKSIEHIWVWFSCYNSRAFNLFLLDLFALIAKAVIWL